MYNVRVGGGILQGPFGLWSPGALKSWKSFSPSSHTPTVGAPPLQQHKTYSVMWSESIDFLLLIDEYSVHKDIVDYWHCSLNLACFPLWYLNWWTEDIEYVWCKISMPVCEYVLDISGFIWSGHIVASEWTLDRYPVLLSHVEAFLSCFKQKCWARTAESHK